MPADAVARARERFSARDYHGTVLLLQESLAEGTAYADAYNLMGLALALVGRPVDALAAFDRALALNERYVEAHLNRAVLLTDLGRTEEAARAFAVAERLDSPDETGYPTVIANRLANTHGELANEYRAAGNLDEAIVQYERALQLRPGYHDIRLAMARALIERGRHAEARRELDAVLAGRAEWLDAMLLRGLTAYLLGDLDDANDVWSRAAARHGQEPRLEIYRAMLARRRAQRE